MTETPNQKLITEAKHLNGPAGLVDLACRLATALEDAEQKIGLLETTAENSDVRWKRAIKAGKHQQDRAEAAEAKLGALPDDLRSIGWMVVCHNDYRKDGETWTFWSMTFEGQYLKGEGRTDAEALDQIRQQLGRPLSTETDKASGEAEPKCPVCKLNAHWCTADNCPFAQQEDHFTYHSDGERWQCDGCGAKAASVREIEHSESCRFAQQGAREPCVTCGGSGAVYTHPDETEVGCSPGSSARPCPDCAESEYRDPEQPNWAHDVNANDLRKALSEPDPDGGATPQERDGLRAALEPFVKMSRSIIADLHTAHILRGEGANSEMRADDRELRADFRQAIDDAKTALASKEPGDAG